ncbi:transcriptional regulator [Sulfurimonas sediminis]|uniref:Transcriptional regulator n=1 Tax=Sulfurimonas sediminis TaxID=2590020 RepID=A0A7M1B2A1_9BACT|nr:YtfJ family protein [Sulfurimonas sediminis]QOP43853.1 transcriptional regulator [Sulfurimonas sediminis]
MKRTLGFLALMTALNLFAITVGEKPKEATLEKENGGYAKDGSAWNSNSIKEKVYVMFYVDPDEKDANEAFSEALKKKEYRKRGAYGSIAIVNLAATWKPNFIIESLLKSKQKEFPDTIYVKDKNKVLVKEWNLADDSSDIIIFDKNGKVLFYKAGKMSKEDMQKAFTVIEENL